MLRFLSIQWPKLDHSLPTDRPEWRNTHLCFCSWSRDTPSGWQGSSCLTFYKAMQVGKVMIATVQTSWHPSTLGLVSWGSCATNICAYPASLPMCSSCFLTRALLRWWLERKVGTHRKGWKSHSWWAPVWGGLGHQPERSCREKAARGKKWSK